MSNITVYGWISAGEYMMEDRSGGLTQFEFEITHRCNKNCKLCDHRIATSDYHMTLEDYDYVIERIGDTSNIVSVLIIGGEPTVHPDLGEFVTRILKDIPNATVTIYTNGRFLYRWYQILPAKRVGWLISEYPGWNDEVIKEYASKSNVRVYKFAGAFWDPYVDPDLSDTEAKEARQKCLFVCRVLGRRLYDCCLSEPLEREMHIDGISVPFTENWREDIKKLETWRACKHCFRAGSINDRGTMYDKRRNRHDE